jgi:signal transduction histidine kinase
VRKQLFIVRTSGARLLALINDVMDAATLRQRRLVLKQERLQLRQVVGDVVDLTQSLVSEGGHFLIGLGQWWWWWCRAYPLWMQALCYGPELETRSG